MLLKCFTPLCAIFAFTVAMYTDMDAVQVLSPANFKQNVLDNRSLVAVEFYASWCGHCQTFAPDWKQVAKKLKGLVTVAAIQCDNDENRDLCEGYGIRRYPTIKIFNPTRNKDGAITKSTKDYLGPRDSKLLVKYLLSNLPSNVRSIKEDARKAKSKLSISLDEFLERENGTLTKVILFNDSPKSIILYNALSVDFGSQQLLMGEVKKSEKKVVDAFGVTKFPTLLVLLPGEGGRSLLYGGKLNYKSLHKYLSNVVLMSVAGDEVPKVETAGEQLLGPSTDGLEQQSDDELDWKTAARDEL